MGSYIEYCKEFGSIEGDDKSRVFQVFPKVFTDQRGSFSEVMKDLTSSDDADIPEWFKTQAWIKQINRSVSSQGTIRGCHAQKGEFCQGKFVEAVNELLYDVIIDGRPDSKTFGNIGVFVLDPVKQNKLWVPRGFLHAFATPLSGDDKKFIFQYFCDNVYSHADEFGISPLSVLPQFARDLLSNKKVYDLYYKDQPDVMQPFVSLLVSQQDRALLSEKDTKNIGYDEWANQILEEYHGTGKVWYR